LIWMGHTEKVSRKHYTRQTPAELWDVVTGRESEKAAQNPAQHPVESPRTASQTENASDASISHNLASDSTLAQVIVGQGIGGGGNRTPVPRSRQ